MKFDYDPDGNFTTHVTGQLSMYPGEPPIACPTPTCKADTGLTVSAVAKDTASKVSCLNGHTWDEPRMPGKAARDLGLMSQGKPPHPLDENRQNDEPEGR